MNELLILLLILLFTSVSMTAAMWLAWAQFSREKHLRLWAWAFGASALQWLLNGLALALANDWVMYASGVAMIASIGFTNAGVRIRASASASLRPVLVTCVAYSVLCAALVPMIGPEVLIAAVIPVFVSAVMAQSAWQLARGPRGLKPAEKAYFTVLCAFALFELVLSGVGWQAAVLRGNALEVYRLMLVIGLPVLFVASAIASILMVASDLANRLSRQSLTDPLTGVYNRRGLDELAHRQISGCHRRNVPVSLIIGDLDGFKGLNDTYGHLAGDAALQQFARTLVSEVRGEDIVCRLGGDEFVILLAGGSANQAQAIVDRVQRRLEAISLAAARGARLRCSFGVAQGDPDDGLHTLLEKADASLYLIKSKRGSNFRA